MKWTIAVIFLLSGCSIIGGSKSFDEPYGSIEKEFDQIQTLAQQGYSMQEALTQRAGVIAKITSKNLKLLVHDLELSSDPDKRILAAFALGFSTSKDVVNSLINELEDQNLSLRKNVWGALASMGLFEVIQFNDVPVEKFKAAMSDSDYELIRACLFALQNLAVEGNALPFMEDIYKLLWHPDPGVRNETIILLGRLKLPESFDRLTDSKLIVDEQPLIRRHLAISLAQVGGEKATPYLIEYLRDADSEVVEVSLYYLIRITGQNFGSAYQIWRDWFEDELKRTLAEKTPKKAVYLCQQHPNIMSDQPGKCRVCDAELIIKPEK